MFATMVLSVLYHERLIAISTLLSFVLHDDDQRVTSAREVGFPVYDRYSNLSNTAFILRIPWMFCSFDAYY